MWRTNSYSSFLLTVVLGAVTGATGLIRVATWNLLAPQYARPEKYPWCDPYHLDWNYRQSLIVSQLLLWNADIICLQEVQVDMWPNFMAPLENIYEGVIQKVKGNHKIAGAILVRKGCPWSIERVESRSRALLAVLRNEDHSQPLYVASVHLEAGVKSSNDSQRFNQVKSLFNRLALQCDMDGIRIEDAAVVLAGDFNICRNNIMHYSLSQGQLYNPKEINTKPPISITKLQDAMSETRAVQMTYSRGFILDYIWTSEQIQLGEALPLSPYANQCTPHLWPSQDQPSDHLPIGIVLALCKKYVEC